jgi:hypothetical protein
MTTKKKKNEEYSEAFEAFLAATTNDNDGANQLAFSSMKTRCQGPTCVVVKALSCQP